MTAQKTFNSQYYKEILNKTTLTKRHLDWAFNRSFTQWKKLEDEYSHFVRPKKRNGNRIISAPSNGLKYIQKKIYLEILKDTPLHMSCHGFRKQRSIITNAKHHVGKEVIINIDLRDFFPTITAKRVHGVFLSLGFSPKPAWLLTRITTCHGRLPQGAPTSPALANIVCRRLDSRLEGLARHQECSYTRYADDITYSGSKNIIESIPLLSRIIRDEGFSIADEKLRIMRKGNRQEVTGLAVNDKVSIPRKIRRRLRAAAHKHHLGKEVTWQGKVILDHVLYGHFSYLRSVHPVLAEKYLTP